jgi:hypothetical protein
MCQWAVHGSKHLPARPTDPLSRRAILLSGGQHLLRRRLLHAGLLLLHGHEVQQLLQCGRLPRLQRGRHVQLRMSM